MFDAILNKIAERSDALKGKDAEIEVLRLDLANKKTDVDQLLDDCAFRDDRINTLVTEKDEARCPLSSVLSTPERTPPTVPRPPKAS